jgi:hypothetical protein
MVRNTEKHGKWETHTLGPGIWQNKKKLKKNTEKRGKWEMHTSGHGLWWEKWETWKMKYAHYSTCNMSSYTEKCGKWEMHTVGIKQ